MIEFGRSISIQVTVRQRKATWGAVPLFELWVMRCPLIWPCTCRNRIIMFTVNNFLHISLHMNNNVMDIRALRKVTSLDKLVKFCQDKKWTCWMSSKQWHRQCVFINLHIYLFMVFVLQYSYEAASLTNPLAFLSHKVHFHTFLPCYGTWTKSWDNTELTYWWCNCPGQRLGDGIAYQSWMWVSQAWSLEQHTFSVGHVDLKPIR